VTYSSLNRSHFGLLSLGMVFIRFTTLLVCWNPWLSWTWLTC